MDTVRESCLAEAREALRLMKERLAKAAVDGPLSFSASSAEYWGKVAKAALATVEWIDAGRP